MPIQKQREERSDPLSDSLPNGSRDLHPETPLRSSPHYEPPPERRDQRPGPELDPIARMKLSSAAKWLLIVAFLLIAAWYPLSLKQSGQQQAFYLAAVTAGIFFAAVIATALPRLIAPRIFGQWHEAVEAMRDWLIVGLVTAGLYQFAIRTARSLHFGPENVVNMDQWYPYRLPLALGSAVVAVFLARRVAIRRDGLLRGSAGAALLQIIVQAALVGALMRPFEFGLWNLGGISSVITLLGGGAVLMGTAALGIICWSAIGDTRLMNLQRNQRRDLSGKGKLPAELNLTIIGSREAGKTVLLAAAYHQWATQDTGALQIVPLEDPTAANDASKTDLMKIAHDLYSNNVFPVGSVACTHLPFELRLGTETIARFRFLDYPGGVLGGRVADAAVMEEFYNYVDDTDGIIMIADMSYVRRRRRDQEWTTLWATYNKVMQRVVARNGRHRVVPVALVLTKCDEFADPQNGRIDVRKIVQGLEEFNYTELEKKWRSLNKTSGPGHTEFATWITSAIAFSEPALDANGNPDYSKKYEIAPPPPPITPIGCAAPLLWVTAKAMYWNATLFRDVSSFVFGSSPRVRQRMEAIMEMERIANEQAARINLD